MTAPKAKPPTERHVVVTTEHRGVFFGAIDGQDDTATTIKLTEAQMCVYWATDVHGVVGLAANGPSKSCRVTPPAPAITLHGVTSVMDASPEAVTRWRERPWK